MSGFGAYPVDLEAANVSYIVSSANKNIEGVPGFAFALCRKEKLLAEGRWARARGGLKLKLKLWRDSNTAGARGRGGGV
jgi:aspartate aminotransferase-like enzyme